MANSIALASTYLPILDEVYKAESKSAILDTANERIRWTGGQTVYVFKISTDGFGTYNRGSGFVSGSVTSTWEALQLAVDRGISLIVDAMDDAETLDMAFASTLGEFVRVHEVPEVDALTLRAA